MGKNRSLWQCSVSPLLHNLLACAHVLYKDYDEKVATIKYHGCLFSLLDAVHSLHTSMLLYLCAWDLFLDEMFGLVYAPVYGNTVCETQFT